MLGGGLAIEIFYQPGYWHSLVLLTLYGLIPLAFVTEVFLLVGIVIEATTVLPKPPPRRLLRAIQAALLYSLLGPALIMALVSAARIGQLSQPFVPRDTYLPRALNTLLDNVLGWPAFVVRRPLWLVCLGMILYCRVALRRGVLPGKTGLSARSTMGYR